VPGRYLSAGTYPLYSFDPLRAGLAADIEKLDRYPFCGHGVFMGKQEIDWQVQAYVLKLTGLPKKRQRPCLGAAEAIEDQLGAFAPIDPV
jgi:hypothetical protein